jgi:hypothetical protein
MSEPPFPHQYEAVERFQEMQKNGAPLLDLIEWLYKNNFYFQTESGVWDHTTTHILSSNLEALLTDLLGPISYETNVRFVIVDTYIEFRSKSMNPSFSVLLKHGSPNPESNDWPNNVIKTEMYDLLWLANHHQSINKKVINK